jgi:hypothetical protein
MCALLPLRELSKSVEFDCSRFLGFQNRISSLELFLTPAFEYTIPGKKGTGRLQQINGRQ